jgi:hypothetical protein
MMQTKLTLRLEETLIQQAKSYAKHRGKSLSQIVADYFALLVSDEEHAGQELAPLTRSLRGALRGSGIDTQDYHKHLEEKYL